VKAFSLARFARGRRERGERKKSILEVAGKESVNSAVSAKKDLCIHALRYGNFNSFGRRDGKILAKF
jgi:hypothetical protein